MAGVLMGSWIAEKASSACRVAWISPRRPLPPREERGESGEDSPGTQKASETDGWCEENRSADLRASPACATTSTPWTSNNRELYVKLPCPSVPTSCSKVLADTTYITRCRAAQTTCVVLLLLFLGDALHVAGEVHPDVRFVTCNAGLVSGTYHVDVARAYLFRDHVAGVLPQCKSSQRIGERRPGRCQVGVILAAGSIATYPSDVSENVLRG
jgi:hypothetical protein